jgi:hypothetical protein
MLPLSMRSVYFCACLFVLGCKHDRLEESFFDRPPSSRLERLRSHYSLEDQYKIFRYGNDQIEPPVMELAEPIAERGETAVPFLVSQLSSGDDLTVRDVLLIFQAMAKSKRYDVKHDQVLMRLLASKVSGMKREGWRKVCLDMLQGIRNS